MQKFSIRPPSLSAGDKIGIVAPARKVSREEMAPAIQIMQSWGYQVIEGSHLYGDENQFSGRDDERAQDFQAMLDNEGIRAIFCARGGYGSVRIIDRIDFSRDILQKTEHWCGVIPMENVTQPRDGEPITASAEVDNVEDVVQETAPENSSEPTA